MSESENIQWNDSDFWQEVTLEQISRLFPDQSSVNIKDEDGISPIHFAVQFCGPDIVEYMLKIGANPNAKTKNGDSPFHFLAISKNDDPRICDLLIAAGAKINARNKEGNTPLADAVLADRLNLSKAFLEAKANPNIKNLEGSVCAHMAACTKHPLMIELLAQYKAKFNIINKYGETPLVLAAWRGRVDVAESMIDHGALVNLTGPDGCSSLYWAILRHTKEESGYMPMVKLFLDRNAKLYMKKNRISSMFDISKGHEDIQNLLREMIEKRRLSESEEEKSDFEIA